MEIIISLLIGLFAGVGGGLFGIGGGIIIVPCLTFALAFTQHKAQGTSLVALLMPVGILGLINYAKAENVDYKIGAIIALGFLGGAFLGSKLALDLSPIVMKRCFASFLIVVATYMFWSTKS